MDFDDINAFVLGLRDPAAYQNTFGVPTTFQGDFNGDDDLDFDDISDFVDALSGVGRQQAVPEPSTAGVVRVNESAGSLTRGSGFIARISEGLAPARLSDLVDSV